MAGNIKGITIEIGGNTTKLDKALKQVKSTGSDLNKQLKDIEKSLKFNPGNSELITQRQRVLAESVQNSKEKLDTLKEAHRQAQQQLANGQIGQDQFDALTREVIRAENQLNRFERQLHQANSKAYQMGEAMQNFGSKAEQAGKKILPLSLAVGGVGAMSVKTAADFESAMSEVSAISGATGENLEALKEKAKEMGATTKFSASESAEALKYMAMAGWDTQKMLDGLPGIMNLAAASGEELGVVSDIVTDAMTAFGLKADQAGKFADILATASSKSNTNVSLLGESFKYVAPLAGAMGYSVEDVGTALGLMANAGIKGSEAGTTLRSALTRLASPTKDVINGLNMIGLEIADVQGLSLDETLMIFRNSFKELDETQKAQASSMIFGKTAMSGMLAVINSSNEEYESLLNNMYNADGAAKKMADTMNDNLNGQITLLKSALEGLAIKIGDILLPVIKKMVSGVQGFVDLLNNMPHSMQVFTVVIGSIIAVIGPLLIIIGEMSFGLGAVLKLFASFGAATTATTVATAGATTATTGLSAGFASLAGPIAIVIAGLAALTAGAIALYKHFSQSSIQVDLFGDTVSDRTKEAVSSFLDLEAKATNSLNELNWSGKEVTKDMATNIVQNMENMKNEVISKLESQKQLSLRSIKSMYSEMGVVESQEAQNNIQQINQLYDEKIKVQEEGARRIQEILNLASEQKRQLTQEENNEILNIKNNLKDEGIRILSESEAEYAVITQRIKDNSSNLSAQQASEVVKNSLEQKEKTIENANAEYAERIKLAEQLRLQGSQESKNLADEIIANAKKQKDETIQQAEEMHNNILEKAKQASGEQVENVNWATGEIKTRFDLLKEQVVSVWENIKEKTQDAWNKIQEFISKALEIIKVVIDVFIKVVKDLWDRHGQEILATAKTIWEYITTVYKTHTGIIKGVINTFVSAVKLIWENFGGTIKAIAKSAWEGINSIISGVLNIIKGVFKTFTGALKGDWKAFGDGLKTIAEGVWKIIEGIFKTALESITAIIPAFFNIGKNIVEGIGNGILSGASFIYEKVAEVSNNIIGGFKKALNMHSPSRETRDKVGLPISQGIAVGIEKGEKDIINSSNKVSNSLMNNQKNNLTKLYQELDNVEKKLEENKRAKRTKYNRQELKMQKEHFTKQKKLLQSQIKELEATQATTYMQDVLENINTKMQEQQKQHNARMQKLNEDALHQSNARLAQMGVLHIVERYRQYQKAEQDNINTVGKQIETLEQSIEMNKATVRTKNNKQRLEEQAKILQKEKEMLIQEKKNLEEFSGATQKIFDKLRQDYEKAYESIESKQNSLADKLKSFGKLVESFKEGDKEIFKLGDIESQISMIEQYGETIERLKSRGADIDVINQVLNMSVEEAVRYGSLLLNQSNEDFDKYMKAMARKREISTKVARDAYINDLNMLKNEYAMKTYEAMEDLPVMLGKIGVDASKSLLEPIVKGSQEQVKKQNETLSQGSKDTTKIYQDQLNDTTKIWQNTDKEAIIKFNQISQSMIKPINKAKEVIIQIVKAIENAIRNMKIELPRPKIPKVNVSMKSYGKGIEIPTFDISWYKNGAIFTRPTIFNTPYGFKGVGEAGAEAVLPISKLDDIVANAIKKTGTGNAVYNINFTGDMQIRSDEDIRRLARELGEYVLSQNRALGGSY